jgi:hypothetical protein
MPDTVAEKVVSSSSAEEDIENYSYGRGKNWTEENIRTLISWLHTSAVMLDLTREATTYYRKVMRRSTIVNLIFSSVAGTVSLSQFNINNTDEAYKVLDTLLKAFFSAASILVALNTGYIKVYQIQERLESTIQLQQQWSNFGSLITSELQLPTPIRKDALQLINKMKETYHQLIRDHVDINRDILEKVALRNGISPQQLTISDLFERVIVEELNRIKMENGDDDSIIEVNVCDDDDISVVTEYDADIQSRAGGTGGNTNSKARSVSSARAVSSGEAAKVKNEESRVNQLKNLQRSSTHLFENKNTKKLRNLEKKVMNTRTQIANLVMSPRRTTKMTYDNVMGELKSKKNEGMGIVVVTNKSSPNDAVVSSGTSVTSISSTNTDDLTLQFEYDSEGNPELAPSRR